MDVDEVEQPSPTAFAAFAAAAASSLETARQADSVLSQFGGLGVEIDERSVPVPMLGALTVAGKPTGVAGALLAFAQPTENKDMPSTTQVVACRVPYASLDKLRSQKGVRVWPNSPLSLLPVSDALPGLVDLASSSGGVDCRPFRSGVSVGAIRELLGVERAWNDGFRGQNVAVAVLDEGIDGSIYPVVDGLTLADGERRWGSAAVTSHGSMCAADILVATPWAKLYDYPFLGHPSSGGALAMFQAVLDHRRRDGTPHLTNNSYGFYAIPDRSAMPNHEAWDINHPLHRKIREVVTTGIACFFAAGNCGANCPAGKCQESAIGPNRSISGANSLAEVITVAAVNSRHERIGYSAQCPDGHSYRAGDARMGRRAWQRCDQCRRRLCSSAPCAWVVILLQHEMVDHDEARSLGGGARKHPGGSQMSAGSWRTASPAGRLRAGD